MTTHGTLAEPRILPLDNGASDSAERVLVAATKRFARYGYAGTSIRDIAADLGINSATLYSHFPSKSAILRELVRIGHEGMNQRLRAAVASVESDSAADKLRAFVEEDVRIHTDYAQLALIINSQLHVLSPEDAAYAYEIRRGLRDLALALCNEGIANGEFPVDDPVFAMRAASDMVVVIPRWYKPDGGDPEILAKRYGDMAMRLLGVTQTP